LYFENQFFAYKMNFSRRDFLVLTALSSINTAILKSQNKLSMNNSAKTKIKPARLRKNDLVGVVAPGTAVPDPDDILRAQEILANLELRWRFSESITRGTNYRSRSVGERLDELMKMFTDPEIRGIFCIRGGYGSAQLLDKIDYSIISSNPKIFLGYSDITALHIAINKFTGLITFHGPVLLSPFTPYTFNNLKNVLFGLAAEPLIRNPIETNAIRASHPIRTIREGTAEGIVIGGNLSIICSLLGTPYEYDYKDALLLLEDVQEEPYRIDRMLNHLRLAGKLNQVRGIAFGECKDCLPSSPSVWDFSLGEVLDYYFKPLNVPSFYGLCIGHTPDQATIAIGARAILDAKTGTLQYLESVVD